jgi:imidazolonepropionase-like amidohydrolase
MPHRHPSLLAAPAPAPGRLWLTNARLFDGLASGARSGSAVLVSDGVIERVGDAAEAAPEAARVIDLEDRMLLPGLIDLHMHAQVAEVHPAQGAEPILPGTAAHFMQAALRETLARGVTTLRDVGGQAGEPLAARQAMRYGAFRGPRLLTCGRIISATAPGGRFYGAMYREADGPDEVRKAVREQLRAGADFVKVMTTGARSNELEDPGPTQFTDAEFAALVDEARRLGVKVAAHVEGLDGADAAVRYQMDTIEHGMYLHQRPDLLERMASSGQVLVPTLSGYYWMGGMASVIDPSTAIVDAKMVPTLVELAHYNLQQGTLTLRAAAAAGVRIGLGSDAETMDGEGTGLELVRMIHHGLSPADALRAATSVAAEAIGLQEHIGTVQAGKIADLLVIDGDVLAAPELLLDPARVWLVLQSGHPAAGTISAHGDP